MAQPTLTWASPEGKALLQRLISPQSALHGEHDSISSHYKAWMRQCADVKKCTPGTAEARRFRTDVETNNLLTSLGAAIANQLRILISSGQLQQLLVQQLDDQHPSAAPPPSYLTTEGAASELVAGPLGSILQLCAALQVGQVAYTEMAPKMKPPSGRLPERMASDLASTGLFSVLATACAAVAAALQEQHPLQQPSRSRRQQAGNPTSAAAAAAPSSGSCADEAAGVLLWLILMLGFDWPQQASSVRALSPAVLPAVNLAAAVLRAHKACHTAAAGMAPATTAASVLASNLSAGRVGSYLADAAGNSSSSSSSVMINHVSPALLRAGHAAVKASAWMAGVANSWTADFDGQQQQGLTPAARQVLVSDDMQLLMIVVLAAEAHRLHRQLKGCSPVPLPEGAPTTGSSSRSSSSSSSSSSTQGHQQRIQQQKQLLLPVPPFHRALYAAIGIPWAEGRNYQLLDSPADAVLRVFYNFFGRRFLLLHAQGQVGHIYPLGLYAPLMLVFMQLAVLVPSYGVMSICAQLMQQLQANLERFGDSETAAVSVAAAATAAGFEGFRAGLLQPALQLLAPAVLHLLRSTAGEVDALPAMHPLVNDRVAVMSCIAPVTMSFMMEAPGYCDVASLWFDMPLCSTTMLEAMLRAYVMHLAPGELQPQSQADLAQVIQSRAAEADTHYLRTASHLVGAFYEAAVHLGRVKAAADAAADLPQLALQLYSLLVSCCKCMVSSVDSMASNPGPSAVWVGLQLPSIMAAAVGAAMGDLALPAAPQAPRGGTSTSVSGSGSSTSQQHPALPAGPGPWLSLIGRCFLLSSRLLGQLPHYTPGAADASARDLLPRGFTGDGGPDVGGIMSFWSNSLSAVQQQLGQLQLPGAAGSAEVAAVLQQLQQLHAGLSHSLSTSSTGGDALFNLLEHAKFSGDAALEVADGPALQHWLTVELPQRMREFGQALTAQLPQRACCSNPGCVNLNKLSELQLATSRCSACRAAAYCSKACFRKHWPQHKAVCKRLQGSGSSSS